MEYPGIIYGLIPALTISFAFITPMIGLFIKNRRFFMIYMTLILAIVASLAGVIAIDIFGSLKVKLYPFGGWPPPVGISYIIDRLNASLAFVASIVILLSVIASTSYLDKYKHSTISYIYTAVLGFTAGVMGSLYTGDIFNLFVMMEVMCISLYVMVSFHRTKAEAVEATIKYSLISIVALALYFLSTILIYGSYQTLNMADLAIKSRPNVFGDLLPKLISQDYYADIFVSTTIAIAIIIWVFTLESALFPNHFWLPDAISEAPTPVSSMLPVAEMVSVYAIIRYLFTIFGSDSILAQNMVRTAILIILLILGLIASVVGSIMMAMQRDAKRLLGYSSISHVGFIYTAIGLTAFSQNILLPLTAALFHTINYVMTSSQLFLAIGSLEKTTGTRDLDVLKGLGRHNPIVATSIVIGVLNLVGLPPLGGFFSKLMIYQAALELSQPVVALIVIIATAISIMGYAKLLLIALGSRITETKVKEIYRFSIPSIILAIVTILLGILLPLGLYEVINEIARTSYDYGDYIRVFITYMQSLWPR
ncbi:MAG: proton-conducting transporter membrane subunit [Ignisphaera sp.]